MLVVRPAIPSDLEALLGLAHLAGVGLTTLPKDRDLLARRVQRSVAAFQHFPDRPGGESFLFVAVEAATGQVVGTSGITSKVGGFEPFYSYRIEDYRFESSVLGIAKSVPVLKLIEEHDGPCEVGSLFLHPDHRRDHNGRFLQLVRFLFMAEHPEAFETQVVSEIRGVTQADGRSPFWDALGRHFFGIDFAEADRLSVVNKRFIADLMPRHPIYLPLLPEEARAVVGQPHPDSTPALHNLEREGFRFANSVDIFDAGPVFHCPRDQVRAIRDSRRWTVAELAREVPEGQELMLGTCGLDFRAVKDRAHPVGREGLRITLATARALGLQPGDRLRAVPLTPPKNGPTPTGIPRG